MEQTIRPEVQQLIDRAAGGGLRIEISEVDQFLCNETEAHAVMPWLTNDSLARRIDRVLANLPASAEPPISYLDGLKALAREAQRRLERL
jgi:hypothetical protein